MLKYLNNYSDIEVNCLIWIAMVWPRPPAVCAVVVDQAARPRSPFIRMTKSAGVLGMPEGTLWAAAHIGVQEVEHQSVPGSHNQERARAELLP